MRVATVATPCGPFTVMAAGDVVVASGWTADVEDLMRPVAPASRPRGWRACRHLGAITEAVRAYFDGALDAIGAVEVGQRSGPFVEAAWQALRAVPAGSPVSYAALAERSGRPGAARAAGMACQRNAAALFVPCHRAVRGDGALGGFRWGLAVKAWLLDHEAGDPDAGDPDAGDHEAGDHEAAQMGSLRGTASSVWNPPLT